MDLFSTLADITRPTTTSAFIPVPVQPEERKTTGILFTSIPQVFEEIRKIGHADKMNFAQFNALYNDLASQSAAIMAMIQKMTMTEINKYIYKKTSNTSSLCVICKVYYSLM